jgi:predicted amidohydrolase
MQPTFKFAAIQLLVTENKEKNLSNVRELIGEAVSHGAQVVALPVRCSKI